MDKSPIFNEIAIKTKIDYEIFQNYLYQHKNEYSIHNTIKINEDKYAISGLGIVNLLYDYKIQFKENCNNDLVTILELDDKNILRLENLIEFYLLNNNKFDKVNLEYILIIKDLSNFYRKYSSYFNEVDNYFKIDNKLSLIAVSSVIILSRGNNREVDMNIIGKNILIGEDIFTFNSHLGTISYDYFSKSISKGIISNKINDSIYLLDIRVLPNSHGSLVYNSQKQPIAFVIPILNVKYSYTPIIFCYKIDNLFKIFERVYNPNPTLNQKYIKDIPYDTFYPNILNSVFIIYNQSNYASCFYIGKGLFITNKHFFNNYDLNDEVFYIKNKYIKLECKKIYIPNNNMDLAIIGLKSPNDYKFEEEKGFLMPIKINDSTVNVIDKIYSVTFSYFDKIDIINNIEYPNVFKGIISKIVKHNNKDFVYQIDCASYSGGSGGPIVNPNGELVGVLFQNLSFYTSKLTQLPNSGIIISKNIIEDIVFLTRVSNSLYEDLSKLDIFRMPNSTIDKLLNFNKFNPKF